MRHAIRAILVPCIALLLILTALPAQAQFVELDTPGDEEDFYHGPIYRFSTTSTNDFSSYVYHYTAAELSIPAGATIDSIQFLLGPTNTALYDLPGNRFIIQA